MVVIKQSFKAFLTKHKLDDAPAAARADDDDDYRQGKIESVALETGYRSSPRAREKFMISAEGSRARAAGAERAGRRRRAGDVVRGRVLKMASTDNEWLKLDGAVGYVLLHGRSVGCGELLRREAEAAASEAAPAEAPEAAEADGRRLGEARFTVAKDWKERLARACPSWTGTLRQAPCSVVIAPYAEERVVDDFALKGRSRAGGLAVLPLEYRGLVLGPLLLGTFGYTDHALVNRQQQGSGSRRCPTRRTASPAAPRLADGEPGFAGVAVSTSDGPCELEGSYAHLNAKAAPATASLRQLGAEPARRRAECGLWAAATLDVRGVGGRRVVTRDDRTVFDQACVATLAVRVDDERGRASWSRAKLIGRCQDCDGAAKWVFEGPAWDADAPEPRDLAGRGHLACLLDARGAETFTWPPELRPADCDARGQILLALAPCDDE
ncbi:SET domain-containing protein [Aureococcus anophagefferens]|nr:SET domain-containing protein [Aureococcus anophagefferens]